MNKLIATVFLALSISTSSFSQFQKEAEYTGNNLYRVVLQDLSERYFYFLDDEIKINDADHQLLTSISIPECLGDFKIQKVRSDFDNIGLGILCSCETSDVEKKIYILDETGNIVKEFIDISSIDDRYIIEYDEIENHNYVYNTQTLELIEEIPGLKLQESLGFINEQDYYFAHNNIDSIYIFDSSLVNIRQIGFDFNNTLINKRLTLASVIEDDEVSFYFLVSEYTDFSDTYYKLLDDDGITLYNPPQEILSISFHKYDETLQLLSQTDDGILSYDLKEKELFGVVNQDIGTRVFLNRGGKYIAQSYNPNSTRIEFYDYKRELESSVTLNDPYLFIQAIHFQDLLGQEYFLYQQSDPAGDNVIIYKEKEYLQTISNSRWAGLSSGDNLSPKIGTTPANEDRIDLYGIGVSNTKELIKNALSLSPNPVSESIRVSSTHRYTLYKIYDSLGRIVQSDVMSEVELIIQVSHLEKGIYLIGLESEKQRSELNKFIKI